MIERQKVRKITLCLLLEAREGRRRIREGDDLGRVVEKGCVIGLRFAARKLLDLLREERC